MRVQFLAPLSGVSGAAAPIRPLAWELPYAAGAALKSQKEIQVPLPCGLCESCEESKFFQFSSQGVTL